MPTSPGVARRGSRYIGVGSHGAEVLLWIPNLLAPKITQWFIERDIYRGRSTIHKCGEVKTALPRGAGSESKFNLRAWLGGGCNYHDNEVWTGVDVVMAFGFTPGLPAVDIFIRRTRECTQTPRPGIVVSTLSLNTPGRLQPGWENDGLKSLFEQSGRRRWSCCRLRAYKMWFAVA